MPDDIEADSTEGGESIDDFADVDPDNLDEEDPEKMIQKLSGKLAYELREFDDEEKYSDTAKFAMSMTTSALQTDKMSDSDKNSIEAKLDAKFGDTENAPEEDMPEDDLGDDVEIEENNGNNFNPQQMTERIIFTKAQFLASINEAKLYEGDMEDWASNVANMFNSGKIKDTSSLLKIIENNIEDHDLDVDFYALKQSFESKINSSRVTGEMIMSMVTEALPKPAFDDTETGVYEAVDLSMDLTEDADVDTLINRDWTVATKKYKIINWLLSKSQKDEEGNPEFSPEDMSKVWSGVYGKTKYSDMFFKLPKEFQDKIRSTVPKSKYSYANINGRLMSTDEIYKQAGVFDVTDTELYKEFKQAYNALLNDTTASVDEEIYFDEDSIYDVDSDKILFDEDEDITLSQQNNKISNLSSIDLETLRKLFYTFSDEVETERINSRKSYEKYGGVRPWGSGLVKHLDKLFMLIDYYKFDISGIDYDINYTLSKFNKYPNSPNYKKQFNTAYSKLNLLKDKLQHLSGYKHNFWQAKLFDGENRKDDLAKSIYKEIDKLYSTVSTLSVNIMNKFKELNSTQTQVEFDENVNSYSEKPKKIKNKKYTQDYFGMDVGRVVGDDDAKDYIIEIDDEENEETPIKKAIEPRNPFKYRK